MPSPLSDADVAAVNQVLGRWHRVLDGELAAGNAEREVAAAAPELSAELSTAAATELAVHAGAAARVDASAGLRLARLYLRAVGVDPDAVAELPADRLDAEPVRRALTAWVDVCAFSLAEIGDPDLLDRARQATWLLQGYAQAKGDAEQAAVAEWELAALLIHVYTSGRVPRDFVAADADWRSRSFRERALRGDVGLSREMPSWEEALAEAVDLVESALPELPERSRGVATYDLMKLLHLRGILDERPTENDETAAARMRELAERALPLLPVADHPVQRMTVLELAGRHGATIERAELEELRKRWPDDIAYRFTAMGAFDCAWHLSALWEMFDPSQALRIMREAAEMACRLPEENRRQARTQEVILIGTAYAPWVRPIIAGIGWSEAVDLVTDHLDESGRLREIDSVMPAGADVSPVTSVAAAMIELARQSGGHDPVTGRRLLASAELVCPQLVDRHSVALRMLNARLVMDTAPDIVLDDPARAVSELGEAARILLDLGLPETALKPFAALADILSDRPDAVGAVGAVLEVLGTVGPTIERDGGTAGRMAVRSVAAATLASLVGGPAEPDDLLRVTAVVKGPRFATAYTDPAAFRRRLEAGDPVALRGEIEDLRAAVGIDLAIDESATDNELWLEQLLLTAYLDSPAAVGGSTPAQRMANLQRSYDRRLTDLVFGDPTAYRPVLSPDIRAALPPGTVLVDVTASALPNGQLGLYVLVFAANGPFFATIVGFDIPYADVHFIDGDRRERISPLAAQVQAVREQILVRPGRGQPVNRAGGERLERDALDLLGERTLAFLDQLREDGAEHLCVVPHGPLHFYPWHLLTRDGRTLADDWVVTVQPNRQLLCPPTGQPRLTTPPTRQLTALGMTFMADPRPGLNPLPTSADEARDVAALFGAEPLLDADCTAESMLAALTESSWLHLSTHGRHNVAAPSFHCVYLSPSASNLGHVTAADILRLDLRGLELVTMSACETALGRFDDGDNLRGLPGALLLAGAQTIIGTLWPVRADVTHTFFVAFYTTLRDGAPKLVAFREAQRRTRAAHPQHRDWGAFSYLGAP